MITGQAPDWKTVRAEPPAPEEPKGPTPGKGTAMGCLRPSIILGLIALYVAGASLAAMVLGWIILTFASLFGWVGAWSWAQQLATGALAVFVIGSLRGMLRR